MLNGHAVPDACGRSCIGCRVEESPKEYLECGECMIGNFGAIHLGERLSARIDRGWPCH